MEIEKIKIGDKDYPARLANIEDAPREIYVMGNKSLLNEKGIAIVGSRDCTNMGKENARIFAANIASQGLTIISGMARGIDSAAHLRSIGS